MAWRALSSAEFVLEGFNATEREKLAAAAGGDDGMDSLLPSAIAEWRGVMSAAGYEVDADTAKIPDSCRAHIIASVRWRMLVRFPALRQLQTEERKAAADKADEKLIRIEDQDAAIEPPTAPDSSAAGSYGGETKIVMRTSTSTSSED